jgi:hypothetical protein
VISHELSGARSCCPDKYLVVRIRIKRRKLFETG